MIHAVERPRASLAQIGLAMFAVLALTFSFFSLAQPVRADHVEGSTVELNQDLGAGVDSSDPGEFAGSDEDCADVEEGAVLFHFVANQLADGTTVEGSSLTATFADHPDVTVDGYSPSGREEPATIHFDVVLDQSATLTDAWAHFSIAQTEDTNLLLSHVCDRTDDEVDNGLLEIEKFFCPTDGETRTEFDVFGPAEPRVNIMGETEGDEDGCTIGAGVEFTVYAANGETWLADLVTGEDGIVEHDLAPGDYVLCEDMSEECVEFSIGPDGAVTAIVVVNYVAAPQGQIKILKYFCDAEEDSVEFYLEGQAPNLESCDPGDAEFTLDGGESFWTEGGIAVIWTDEGTHTLAEVGTDASVELEVVEGEITTVIVLNNQGAAEEQGQLQVLKYFCDGEVASTEFFAEGEEPSLEGCEPGDALFRVDDGESFSTVDGEAWVNLDAGTGYVLTELSSEAWTTFDIAAGEVTAITVVNTLVTDVPQGQIKVLKYECESDEDGVEFVLEGDAPADLEDCDPADAEFSLDGGAAFSTTGGIAIVWADEGTHTLAEVETDASVEVEVVADAIATVIVLNHVEADVSGGGGNGGQGGEGAVRGGQGGPGTLPDTAAQDHGGLAAGVLALLMVLGLGGLGAANLQAVRRRIG